MCVCVLEMNLYDKYGIYGVQVQIASRFDIRVSLFGSLPYVTFYDLSVLSTVEFFVCSFIVFVFAFKIKYDLYHNT